MCAVCFNGAQLLPVAGVLARAVYVARGRGAEPEPDAADEEPG